MTPTDDNRVALVTGASRGIGAAIARRLARDGLSIAINSHTEPRMIRAANDVAREIQSNGGRAAVYAADIADPSSVDLMFARCEQELGQVDVLVLNAATTTRTSWLSLELDEWARVIGVNLTGAFQCCQRAFRDRVPSEGGAVVAISSILAKIGAQNSLHYGTSKAGIIGFTRSLARELGPRNVRVNCVMPGAIRTEEEFETFGGQHDLDSRVLASQVLQFRGEPDDIAGVVHFLVGSDSAFITGQTICVDGGSVFL
ncbi:3-oxoacyl-ACP reductase FabG [Saccharomonospora sp. NPDC046836]|uniref:SDR family NAD(P)-dependent oxidoreductase n=1 Tax=Saccharomonospora sp. NPDC046836 TaxID=3156921 RepID=UPI0033CE5A5C